MSTANHGRHDRDFMEGRPPLVNLARRSIPRREFLGTTSAAVLASLVGTWTVEGAEKVLTIAIPSNPVTFDPVNSGLHDAMVVSQSIFENLVEVDVDGKTVQPQLATALPKISADRLNYTFELRDDVYFQNGQKFGADDVKYSFEYVLDPKNNALRRPLFSRIKNVVVESPLRVRIELSEQYRPWLFYLTKYMGIFPKGSREKYGADFFKTAPVGVGTGPGIFVEWRQNDSITLKKYPNYWRKGLPHWDRLVVRLIPEDSVRVAYLTTGQVDIISAPPPKDFGRLKALRGIRGDSKPMLGGFFLMGTNNKKPPFDDINARKAVSHAIDRAAIAQKVFYGLLDPSAIPAPPRGWWFSKEANDLNDFDLAKAEAALKRSKYPNGFSFDMSFPSVPYLLDIKDAAVVIQSQLAKLNININFKINEMGTLLQQFRNGDLTAFLFVSASPGEPTYNIDLYYGKDNVFSKGTGYENPMLWQLVRESYLHNSQEELKPIFDRMLRILATDSPNIWFGFVQATNLWRESIKGFQVNQGLTMRVREVDKA
jgi:peptide/nickel transport system substrate-binding protein